MRTQNEAELFSDAKFEEWCRALNDGSGAAYRSGLLSSYRDLWSRLPVLTSVSVEAFGTSVGAEPIWLATHNLSKARPVFVLAGLHAMEHLGPFIATQLLERADQGQTHWRRGLVVMPIANPDGFLRVEEQLSRGFRGFTRLNDRKVDLNRNFSAGAATHPWKRRWDRAGAAPNSENETQAVVRAIERFQPSVAVSLHSFGNLLYLPFAHSRKRPANYRSHLELAERMTRAQVQPFRTRQLGRHIPFFRAAGTELDYFHSQGALSFLMEIGSGPRITRPRSLARIYQWYTPPRDLANFDIHNTISALEALAALD